MACLLVPPPVGVLLALIKPQVGGGVVVYWTVRAWRTAGARGVVRLLLPATIAISAALIVYGPWFHVTGELPAGLPLFPWGVPMGVWLLVRGIQTRRPRWALAASPFFAPYVQFYSLAVLMLLAETRRQALIVAGLTWIVFGVLLLI